MEYYTAIGIDVSDKCRVVFKTGKFVVSKTGMAFSSFSPPGYS